MKYRIQVDGYTEAPWYNIQKRFWIFWFNTGLTYSEYHQAQRAIDIMERTEK